MRRFFFWLFLIIGSVIVYKTLGDYWVLAWVALFLVYAVLAAKLPRHEAVKLFWLFIFIIGIWIGGFVIMLRILGDAAGWIWFVACLSIYMVSLKKIKRMVPLQDFASGGPAGGQTFEKV